MTAEKELKGAIKSKKLTIGTRSVLRSLKRGELASVIRADNCPEALVKDLERYAKASKVGVSTLKGNSSKLGELCGKPFNVLLAGIKR